MVGALELRLSVGDIQNMISVTSYGRLKGSFGVCHHSGDLCSFCIGFASDYKAPLVVRRNFVSYVKGINDYINMTLMMQTRIE